MSAIIPIPRIAISVRPGTLDDVPFLDSLQKLHTRQVGWMPTAQFEGKIKAGHVLIAEEGRGAGLRAGSGAESNPLPNPDLDPNPNPPVPVGYLIGNDRYFKRDDVGIIYQLNVVPGRQRGLIGATLLKTQFERSAWGCRLYCCWCAQDIEANYFWQALGFVPLAFRTGSARRGRKGGGRVHIFWQRRIRAGDVTTPYWFPSQTSSGSIREDRLVLPIPPGTHWSDAKPIVLPGAEDQPKLEDRSTRPASGCPVANRKLPIANLKSALPGLRFGGSKSARAAKEKPRREKMKNDPRHIAAARELRDRWLERVNADPSVLASGGKYDVSRSLGASTEISAPSLLIEHAPIAA